MDNGRIKADWKDTGLGIQIGKISQILFGAKAFSLRITSVGCKAQKVKRNLTYLLILPGSTGMSMPSFIPNDPNLCAQEGYRQTNTYLDSQTEQFQ